MTEEIKEILKKINYVYDVQLDGTREQQYMRDIRDYITNLQQENKEYSMIFDTFSKRPYAHKYLEEKKKELNNNKIIGLDSEMVYKDYYDYKSRFEKTIEYINFVINHYKEQLETPIEDTYFNSDVNRKGYILSIIAYLQTILDILNGSDENEC